MKTRFMDYGLRSCKYIIADITVGSLQRGTISWKNPIYATHVTSRENKTAKQNMLEQIHEGDTTGTIQETCGDMYTRVSILFHIDFLHIFFSYFFGSSPNPLSFFLL